MKRECISIGPLCTAAQTLKDLNFRKAAYPFDWMFSNLVMIQECVEDKFATLLDRSLIVATPPSGSTHLKYHSIDKPTFNHHNLAGSEETYQAFCRRALRFLEAWNDLNGIGLLYMTKLEPWLEHENKGDREYLQQFCEFVAKSSPKSVVIVMILCRSGQNTHELHQLTPNCYIANIHYGETDNLIAVQEILNSIL